MITSNRTSHHPYNGKFRPAPGITGLSPPKVHIDGEVWHLDVGSSHPGAVVGAKGWLGCSPIKAVRKLGSERRETVRSLSIVVAGNLQGAVPSKGV